MHKLGADEFKIVEELLKTINIHLVVNSVLEGSTTGIVFIDDKDHPKSAFVWARNRLFLAGKNTNEEFNSAVKKLFDETIYPDSQLSGVEAYSLFYSPDDWGDVIFSVSIIRFITFADSIG